MKLLILKTDIASPPHVALIKPQFDAHPGIFAWSVDTEDIDNVLRIEASEALSETEVGRLLQPAGFHCENLPD